MRRNKAKTVLLTEEHPDDYTGYEFITLVRYNDKNFLTIVDNVIDNSIILYVLDFCDQTTISEERIIEIVNDWYENNRKNYPLSIEFSKQNLSNEMSKILREFNVDFVTRIIGPVFKYPMMYKRKIKRRKKKPVPVSFTS